MSLSWPELQKRIETELVQLEAASDHLPERHLLSVLHATVVLREAAGFIVDSHNKILPAFKRWREISQKAINGDPEAKEQLQSAIGSLGAETKRMYAEQKHTLVKTVDFLIDEPIGPFGHIVHHGGSFLANDFFLRLVKDGSKTPALDAVAKMDPVNAAHNAAHHIIDRLWPHFQKFEEELLKRDRAKFSTAGRHQPPVH